MWQEFFDETFVINLEKRTDRLQQIDSELTKHGITYTRFNAIENDNGAVGLLRTMKKLFEYCIEMGYKNVLVFEDDATIIQHNPNSVLEKCIEQLPENYLCFFIGINLMFTPKRYSKNLLKVGQSYACHAVGYSVEFMKIMLPLIDDKTPFDVILMNKIQRVHGRCYCAYPMICSQRVGYSNIEKKVINWHNTMMSQYKRLTQNI